MEGGTKGSNWENPFDLESGLILAEFLLWGGEIEARPHTRTCQPLSGVMEGHSAAAPLRSEDFPLELAS